ncbi:MAG: hypothetical protein AAB965_03805 [Patescibacteria group bacterium]
MFEIAWVLFLGTLAILGATFAPRVTLAVVLCSIGHPVLGAMTFVTAVLTSDTTIKKVTKTKYIDNSTGRVLKEIEGE